MIIFTGYCKKKCGGFAVEVTLEQMCPDELTSLVRKTVRGNLFNFT